MTEQVFVTCPECGERMGATAGRCLCGKPLDGVEATPSETESEPSDPETAPCSKCQTEISTEAERCPQCGYEPSKVGALSKVVGIGVFLTVLLSLFLILLQGGIWTGLGVLLLLISGGLSVPLFIYAAIRERKTPTNDSLF